MLPPFSAADIRIDSITTFFHDAIEAAVLRLDQLHPVISGNKWFKLRYYLDEALTQHKKNIITFGGAWSNHIIATAAACRLSGLSATGIIRGEEPADWSDTLLQAKEWGMRLVFLPRSAYAAKQLPAELLATDPYIIPEGGYGEPGAKGAATLLDHCPNGFTHYCCAAGTGTMMAGLINAAIPGQQVTGISVLKNNRSLPGMVRSLLMPATQPVAWQLRDDYHFGGYAKYEPRLLQFMNDLYSQTGIPTDFVYTGKLFYAVKELAQEHFFPPGSRLLIIHSGGLQGNKSLRKGTLMF